MKYLTLTISLISIISLAACTSGSKKVEKHALTTSISGLVQDKEALPTLLFKRPNAPGLENYNSFIVEPVRISYRDPSMQKFSSKDLSRMQTYFKNSVTKELREAGFTVTDQSGPKTMRMTFTVSGVKAPNAAPNVVGVLAPVALSVGEITIEASFKESMTGRTDAVVIDRSQGSRVLNMTPWSTWSDIESTFDRWADGIRRAVAEAHSHKQEKAKPRVGSGGPKMPRALF